MAPGPSFSAARLVHHGLLASWTAALFGVADGLRASRVAETSVAAALSVTVGVMALLGLLLGAAQGLVVGVGERAAGRGSGPEPVEGDPPPIVRRHARGLAGVLLLAAGTGAFAAFVAASPRIKDEPLRATLVVIAAGLVVGVALALFEPSSRRLLPPLRWLHERVGLPVPRWAWARFLLGVWLPLAALVLQLFLRFGEKLGVTGPLFGLALFFATEALLHRLAVAVGPRMRIPLPARLGFLAVGVLALSALSLVTTRDTQRTAQVTAGAVVLPHAIGVLKNVTDVDRDGISSLFGGRDCAPLDPGRSPAALDVPGNGVDEDCDGADATVDAVKVLRTYYDHLQSSDVRRYNVMWLVVDSLRPDHLQLYGYSKANSPYMRELAKEGWVFERAFAQSSTTSISVPSMLAGRFPGSMRWQGGGMPATDPGEVMLPRVLAGAGYYTALLANTWVGRHLKRLQEAFDHVLVSPKEVDWRSGEATISNAAVAMSEAERSGKPFFVMMHVDDVHHPYTSHRGKALPTFPNRDRDVAAYDKGIANFDNMLRQLTAHMKNVGVWDDTIFVLSSDHGEEFGEHGGSIHSATCYVESVHVPLVVIVPGMDPARVDARVGLVDVAPMIVELLDAPREAFHFDGQSLLVPALDRDEVDPSRLLFCSIFQIMGGRKNFFIRSVRDGTHTLVAELLSDKVELYDVEGDPREKTDVSRDPAVAPAVEHLLGQLRASRTGNIFEARRFQ